MTPWPAVRLGDICEIVSGATPRTADRSLWDGEICWVTPKDVSELRGKYIGDTPRKLTEEGLRSCSANVLPAGSVLLTSRAPIGLVAINTVPMATNQGFKSLVPDRARVYAGYLYRWLDCNRAYLQGLGRGATFAEISKGITREISIPLPPLEEQRRIAATLDQADELRTKRRASLVLLELLSGSIFLDMFGDVSTNSRGLPCQALGTLVSTTSGGTPDRTRRDFYGGGVPWVKSGELRNPVICETEETISTLGLRGSSAKLMPPGTVLLAMYGATAGSVATLGVEAATNQAICCIAPSDKLCHDYLVHCLRSLAPSLLEKRVGGAQPNLSQGLVRSLLIPLPPMRLQMQFTSRVTRLNALGERVAASWRELDALFASLQSRAFSGQL